MAFEFSLFTRFFHFIVEIEQLSKYRVVSNSTIHHAFFKLILKKPDAGFYKMYLNPKF
ncbi:hypothetical protein SAMN05428642_10398 [Flaviramulus basaltis]|uniref:Uncharacterized protein n=1 Tax=Flaviramulus basaltis TaxID=369401 RepID=A0A1K2IME3_9FLAO|nr:hypothetical protein SAMN05428642_10398 [Flaviramulus basaltis]